jgi:hypothetical protein
VFALILVHIVRRVFRGFRNHYIQYSCEAGLNLLVEFLQESFASVPDIQLMRCADYFGRAFAAVTTAQFGWNKILRENTIVKAIDVSGFLTL